MSPFFLGKRAPCRVPSSVKIVRRRAPRFPEWRSLVPLIPATRPLCYQQPPTHLHALHNAAASCPCVAPQLSLTSASAQTLQYGALLLLPGSPFPSHGQIYRLLSGSRDAEHYEPQSSKDDATHLTGTMHWII